jgi:uncharacterized protein (DUF2132 family)
MSAKRFVVVHTLCGTNHPNFKANIAWGTRYGWDTENVDHAWVTTQATAERAAAELNGKMPERMRTFYHEADHWRAEPVENWL